MGKRILALILMAVMMLTMGAQAVDTFAVKDTISLSFDGTTAICSATCKGSNTDDKVKATLTLVSEGKTVASWSASDSYSASISESCEVVQGKTYTQVIGDADISSAPLSRVSRCVQYGTGYVKALGEDGMKN